MLWLKTSSNEDSSSSAAVKTMSDEAFSAVIKNHHSRVLSQLRLDHEEDAPVHSGDSGIQDMQSKPTSSLSKIKAMRFGLGGGGNSKSQKSLLGSNNNNVMKRCESLDLEQKELSVAEQKEPTSIKSQLRRYSEVFNRKLKLSTPNPPVEEKSLDDESFNTLEPARRRLRRSTITSKWENVQLEEEEEKCQV